jgi:hypothetical protein
MTKERNAGIQTKASLNESAIVIKNQAQSDAWLLHAFVCFPLQELFNEGTEALK